MFLLQRPSILYPNIPGYHSGAAGWVFGGKRVVRVNFKIITRQKNEAVLSNLCGMHLQSDAADRLQLG